LYFHRAMKATLLLPLIILYSHVLWAQPTAFYPLRISEPMTLDGKLNEPAWQQTPMQDNFMQTDPIPGGAPSDRTEVRVLYNNEYLYIGFRCFDSLPDKIVRLNLDRDVCCQDDGTAIIIDTYNDKNTGTMFSSNTLNARWDEQMTSDCTSEDNSYNTYWDVASHIDSVGYCTEYRIPFSSLRFETKPIITMGFRVARLIYRKNELLTCPRMDPSVASGWCNISYANEMVFEGLKSKTPFYISPYAIANYSMQNVLNEDGTAYEKQSEFLVRKNYATNETLDKIISNIGVDAKWGLTKNLTLDLTLNTDFAQAEVDDIIINLSKYEVNLPEKRAFFLESASNLTFSFPSGNEVFISRSIGNENGAIVPIIAGARLTGKVHGWQIGTLDMQTKSIGDIDVAPHNFFVFRTRKDIDKLGSFIGGIITNRLNTDSTHSSNQSIGISALKRLNTEVSVLAGAAATLNDADFTGVGKSMYYSVGIYRSASYGFLYGASLDVVEKNFNPVMGYLDEPDHGLASGNFSYQWRAKEKSKVEYWYVNTNPSYRWTLSTGKQETLYADLSPGFTMKHGVGFNVTVAQYKVDTLFEDWYLDEHNAISAGTYKMFNNAFYLSSPSGLGYGGSLNASYGDFYGGKHIYINPDVYYNINRHLSVGVTYEYNRIAFDKFLEVDSSTLYQTNLIRLRISYIISTKLSIKLYTQFDDLNHTITGNFRFRYNPREGTDLYIVIDQGLNTDLEAFNPHLPRTDNREVTVKFVKTFEL